MKILLLVMAIAAPHLVAQEPTVSLKLDMVAWGDDITGLSIQSGKSNGDITARAFRYSTPISYSGPVIVEIYKTGNGGPDKAPEPSADDLAHQLHPLVVEDSKPVQGAAATPKQGLALELEKRRKDKPNLVALAALPASGCIRATVLLAPADGGTYTAYVIDDDPSKLPLGQLRVHNLSPLDIAIRCNGKINKELKTRETFLVSGQNGQLIYELAYKLGDEWKTQENNVIPVRANEQAQMMILKSNNSFFLSTDGASGGFLQIITLRRGPSS